MASRIGQRWPDDNLVPCGTPAAARRHQRRGEPVCFACLEAARLDKALRTGVTRTIQRPDPRPVRNNLPDTPGYQWRARRYPWAEQILARAEAEHGRPANEAT